MKICLMLLMTLVSSLVFGGIELQSQFDTPQQLQTGRYTNVKDTVRCDQANPLLVAIDVTIPRDIESIDQAMEYVLARSGYTLAQPTSPDAQEFLKLQLPEVHRKIGPISLSKALQLLVSPAFDVKVSHIKRVVTIDLKDHEPKASHT